MDMNVDDIRNYCLSKPGTTEGLPFDDKTLVFKVMDKMFALLPLDSNPLSLNLKCDPEHAIELREAYSGVQPGYHMSKVHWNTVVMDGSFTATQLIKWIDDSYNLIVAKLSKRLREELAAQNELSS